MVKVINGVNELSAELAGKTVNMVRGMLSQALNIDPAATAMVNGTATPDCNYVLEDGNELEFVKASGTKGR